jgi:hypothetical protein
LGGEKYKIQQRLEVKTYSVSTHLRILGLRDILQMWKMQYGDQNKEIKYMVANRQSKEFILAKYVIF